MAPHFPSNALKASSRAHCKRGLATSIAWKPKLSQPLPRSLQTSRRRGEVRSMAAEAQSKPRKVMVAIDESDCSRHALEWVLANFRDSFSSSPLVVLTVQSLPDIGSLAAASLGSPPVELIQTIQDNQKKVSLALLERAKEICAQHGVDAEAICEVGNPKEVICETVDKLNIDLLVVGSHGKGALTRALLGSVSNYCVHNAKCPVLVVKTK